MKFNRIFTGAIALVFSTPIFSQSLIVFEPGTPARAQDVNNNFSILESAIQQNNATVTVNDINTDISAVVANLSSGGTVVIRAQSDCYQVEQVIHINRPNTSIIGEQGACLRLADNVNQPVLLIGSGSPTVAEEERISNIRVSNLQIDGNRDGQVQEGSVGFSNVQNNAIGVRGASNVFIDSVILSNARSGGLVISQQSSFIFIRDSIFRNNFFDGIAIDGASDIQVSGFTSELNRASGVSVDTGSSRVLVQNGVIQNNNDNGIFVRFTSESRFKGLSITDNCNFGIFLSHDDSGGQQGVTELVFSDLDIYRNLSAGLLFQTAPENGSVDNVISHSRIGGNTGGAITGLNDGMQGFSNFEFSSFRATGPTNNGCI